MKHTRSASGASLLEVLVSVTLFSVVAASLALATTSTIIANHTSYEMSVAINLLRQKVERFTALDPAVATDVAQLATGQETVSALGAGAGRYTRRWTVTNHEPKYGIARVDVTVEWTSRNALHSVEATAYVCRIADCA
jgi:Tfp pilus assembly protein PilV